MNDLILSMGFAGSLGISLFIFIAVISYLFLPFALFGTKKLIRRQNELIIKQNKILLAIFDEMPDLRETEDEEETELE